MALECHLHLTARIGGVSTTARRAPGKRAAESGRKRQKLRTRRELLRTAAGLIADGRWPTVAEVADAAHVSRRTAYRYFPTQAQLLVEAALDGVRPAMEAALAAAPQGLRDGDPQQRVDTLVRSMQSLAIEHESLLRTMIHLTVLEPRHGKRPVRGARRVDWIELALEPLRPRLSAATHARLVSALSLITGIEAMIVLRDIRGLSDAGAVKVSQWMARAVLNETLRESGLQSATKR